MAPQLGARCRHPRWQVCAARNPTQEGAPGHPTPAPTRCPSATPPAGQSAPRGARTHDASPRAARPPSLEGVAFFLGAAHRATPQSARFRTQPDPFKEAPVSKFHQSQAWTNLRAKAVAAARRADAPCGVCGKPIDYSASGRTPWGPSGHHIISVALDPARALDPTNVRVTHRRCNTSPTHRQVAGMDRARQGRPQEPAGVKDLTPRTPRQPQPWQRPTPPTWPASYHLARIPATTCATPDRGAPTRPSRTSTPGASPRMGADADPDFIVAESHP